MEHLRGAFLDKVQKQAGKDPCFLWTGAKTDKGYGNLWDPIKKKPVGAHRVAYTLFKATIPKGQMVLHRCDVRECVNPAHLFLGTARDNAIDMYAKGRGRGGKVSRRMGLLQRKLGVPTVCPDVSTTP